MRARNAIGELKNPAEPVVNAEISGLLRAAIGRPVYFRVSQNIDGELVIEQVAYLRSEELAALIGFDDRTIRGWAAAGKIPCFKPPGSSVHLFELNEILRWLHERRAKLDSE
jgi:hypothetical protein